MLGFREWDQRYLLRPLRKRTSQEDDLGRYVAIREDCWLEDIRTGKVEHDLLIVGNIILAPKRCLTLKNSKGFKKKV